LVTAAAVERGSVGVATVGSVVLVVVVELGDVVVDGVDELVVVEPLLFELLAHPAAASAATTRSARVDVRIGGRASARGY
jgi:hypothetical protein